MKPTSTIGSDETLSDGHFDDMKGTFMNHLKLIERESREVGMSKKMFLTIEPLNVKPSFKLNLKGIIEEDEPVTPPNNKEEKAEVELDDCKNTTKESESPQSLTPQSQ